MKRQFFSRVQLNLVPTELALMTVTLTLTWSFRRLFLDPDFASLFGFVILAHLGHCLIRRLRLKSGVALAVSTLGTFYGVVAWPYWDTFSVGLPTADTWHHLTNDAHADFGPFRSLVPPVSFGPGFWIILALGLAVIITFSDAATFRAQAAIQAVIPPVGVYVFGCFLARGTQAANSAIAMSAALLAFGLAYRIESVRMMPWTRHDRNRASAWLLASGTFAVLCTAVLAFVSTPVLEDLAQPRVTDLIGNGGDSSKRTIVSPLASVSAQLSSQSDTELFRARSSQPHYWRLTSLDDFDGIHWKASNSYQDLDGQDLEPPDAIRPDETEQVADVTISALSSGWLPTLYRPVTIDLASDIDVRYHADSSSLLVSHADEDLDGLNYSTTSAIATPSAEALLAATGPPDVDAQYLSLPAGFSRRASSIAHELGDELSTPFEKAKALQDYLREFDYDRSVSFNGSSPTDEFLRERRGFCQQFASTFAAMARELGIPSRVAVGFTFGESTSTDESGISEWIVRGRNAHAWPEVYLAGQGWIAFEPTPSRGNPDAAQYTGVPAAQANNNDDPNVTGTSTTTTTITRSSTTASPQTTTRVTPPTSAQDNSQPSVQSSGPSGGVIRVVSAILVVLAVTGCLWILRRRKIARLAGRSLLERQRDDWVYLCELLKRNGVPRQAHETLVEYADRASDAVNEAQIQRLGELESTRRYGDRTARESLPDIREEYREVHEHLEDALSPAQRARVKITTR